MEKTDLTSAQYAKLLKSIFPIIAEKGPSHTTMDHVASSLQMSKRTLYEIFGSKDEMLREVLEHIHHTYAEEIREIVSHTGNVMEAIARVIHFHQKMIGGFNMDFFHDLDTRYRHLRADYEAKGRHWGATMENALKLGIKQGVFRDKINCALMTRLLGIQMESLKRMEEFFPAGITLSEAYNTIGETFLRSIATPKGLEILEKLEKENSELY